MKISIFGLFIRATITSIVTASIYGLLLQFIFSYLNQSKYGPKLTVLNFAGPLLLTILILLVLGLRVLFTTKPTTKIFFNNITTLALKILFVALMTWQTWYIVSFYKMKADSGFSLIFTELFPMTIGLFGTLFLIVIVSRPNHAS